MASTSTNCPSCSKKYTNFGGGMPGSWMSSLTFACPANNVRSKKKPKHSNYKAPLRMCRVE